MTPAVLTTPEDCKVFTPEPLARAMARLLPNRPKDRWLEPCVGQGVFLDALAAAGVPRRLITAVELDRHRGLEAKCGHYLPGVEFLGWARSLTSKFDRIVGNPPYLPLHRLPTTIRAAAMDIDRPWGGKVPRGANTWYAFLCASLKILAHGGGFCFVLPSGWEYADYAADVRERLPTMFANFQVHRSETSFFPGVLDGCVILVADGFKEPPRERVHRRYANPQALIEAISSAESGASVPIEMPESRPRFRDRATVNVRFGEVARVRIGAVTGDSGFYLLNEERRRALGLRRTDVKAVLTRSRHLAQALTDKAAWERLRDAGERVWMFWPSLDASKRTEEVEAYLAEGIKRGANVRDKAKLREPWFRPRLPPNADGFLSGMAPFGPWISLNGMPALTATNTLYTVHFVNELSRNRQAAWSMSLIMSVSSARQRSIGRRYSDGLLKFEPNDVMKLEVPTPPNEIAGAVAEYKRCVRELLRGEIKAAAERASDFILGSKK